MEVTERLFQETVNQAQREAEAESESQLGFDPDGRFGDEQDDEMEATDAPNDDDVIIEVDEQDDEERAEAVKTNLDEIPKWAHNLDPSCKKLPTPGLINCDADETAAQIIDNGIMARIILLYGHYYNNRVNRMPEEYHKDMVENQMGRMDLDGICPYAGEDENGELKLPEESILREYFDNRATAVKWGGDLKVFGGTPWEFMQEAIKTMEMVEKMMRFMVESGFKPDGPGFLKPMDGKSGTPQQKAEFRKHVSQFVQRLFKGTFPDKENYVYFRPASDGIKSRIEQLP